jgi:hypothetical protein
MQPFSVFDQLALTDGLVGYTTAAAWGLLAAIAVLTFCFASIRAALVGNMQEPVAWAMRLLLVVGCLASYNPIVKALVGASADLTELFIERAGWHEYSRHVVEQFEPILQSENVAAVSAADGASRPQEPSLWDRLTGWMAGGVLTVVVFASYYFQFIVFEFIRSLTGVFVSLLRVMGPLLIAAGVLGDGRTMKQWFSSLVQVLLWPVVPPFLMMMTVGTSGLASSTGNTAFVVGQNLVLAFMALLTPLIVSFIMGKGGVSSFGMAVIAATTSAMKAAVPATSTALGMGSRLSSSVGDYGPTAGLAARPGEGGAPTPSREDLAAPRNRQDSGELQTRQASSAARPRARAASAGARPREAVASRASAPHASARTPIRRSGEDAEGSWS